MGAATVGGPPLNKPAPDGQTTSSACPLAASSRRPSCWYGGSARNGAQLTLRQVHGWPDFSFGWRYQLATLLDLGLRVVVPDMMGYAGTVALPHTRRFRRASLDAPC